MEASSHESSGDGVIAIPSDLVHESVERLTLSVGVRKGLTLAGIQRFGDLNGLSLLHLEPLMGLGVGGAAEVMRAIAQYLDVLARCPVSCLYEASAVYAILGVHGLRTVRDLIGLTAESIVARTGIVRTRADAIEAAVRRLASIPEARLRRVVTHSRDGSISLPCVDANIIAALALADTLEDEIYALAIQPRPDDALLLLRWWGLIEWPPPAMRLLASEWRLTPERIRQIIQPHEHRLRLGGVRPPIAARVVNVLLRNGLEMTACQLQLACAEQGLVVDACVLRVLPALTRMGLIGPVRIEFRDDVLTVQNT